MKETIAVNKIIKTNFISTSSAKNDSNVRRKSRSNLEKQQGNLTTIMNKKISEQRVNEDNPES